MLQREDINLPFLTSKAKILFPSLNKAHHTVGGSFPNLPEEDLYNHRLTYQ
jgi:hypothetical protein